MLLHAGTAKAAKLGALDRLEGQLARWQNCSRWLAEHHEDGDLGKTLLRATTTLSAALASLRQGSALQPSHGLFDGSNWMHTFDMDEIRPAILPAARSLLQVAAAGGGCGQSGGGCGLYKGMDIGRGNPAEYQTASVSAAACCWECTERKPDYAGFVYNFESSACYCKKVLRRSLLLLCYRQPRSVLSAVHKLAPQQKLGLFLISRQPLCMVWQPGPGPREPHGNAPLLAGSTACCGEIWAAGDHVPVGTSFGHFDGGGR